MFYDCISNIYDRVPQICIWMSKAVICEMYSNSVVVHLQMLRVPCLGICGNTYTPHKPLSLASPYPSHLNVFNTLINFLSGDYNDIFFFKTTFIIKYIYQQLKTKCSRVGHVRQRNSCHDYDCIILSSIFFIITRYKKVEFQ